VFSPSAKNASFSAGKALETEPVRRHLFVCVQDSKTIPRERVDTETKIRGISSAISAFRGRRHKHL
jgi:hypothetical protein